MLPLNPRLLLWIFVASGFAGLVYQSIWTQYLGLILGHSAYAQVLVLALFMGGMALGAWLVSRKSEWLKKPLMLYALIELIIGIFGVGFHGYYRIVSDWSYTSFFPMLSSGLLLEVGRWVVAGALIFPQCVLLGATFPLMSAGYIRCRPDASGRILAGLYFSNSLGAAIGALTATYVLLPALGLPGTVLTAGVINVFVAIAVWPFAKLEQPQFVAKDEFSESAATAPAFILWAAAITGASSFIYEIVWVRMLSMVLGSTIHAFELMLAAFIAGIAFGGLWLSGRADRLRSPQTTASWAQIAKGAAALSTLFLYNYSFEWVAWLLQILNRSADSGYTVYNIASAAISMVIMFPAAFFAGMTLPLFTLILLRRGMGEKAIGKVYAVNTLGAIIGVVIAIYWCIPFLGLRISLWGAAATDILLGLALLATVQRASLGSKVRKYRNAIFASSLVVLMVSVMASQFDTSLMSSGVFRYGSTNNRDREVVYYKDGRTASVSLLKFPERKIQVIATNGKPDAGIGFDGKIASDEMTMVSAAVLPMLYKPDVKSIGIIGFGSGMSTHFALGNPGVESVDTIEIEPAMVEAARFFGGKVERAYNDPRSHIIIDDAKSYFSTTRKKYDVIMSEPSNPWVSGVATLFTEEFYRFIPQHLNEDGLFVQWVQLYEITPELITSVAKSLLPHFADVHLFQGDESDLIIVASPHRQLPRLEKLAIPKEWPAAFRQELALRGVRTDKDISAIYVGNKAMLQGFVDLHFTVPSNSDFFPILQLEAPKARFKMSRVEFFTDIKTASWAVFEAMTGVEAMPLDYSIPTEINSSFLTFLSKAQGVKARLLEESPPKQVKEELSFWEMLLVDDFREAGKECRFNEGDNDKNLRGLTYLVRQTGPYFRAEDLQGLWVKPAWISCAVKNPLMKDYLGFIEASALRKHEEILALGEKLLDNEAVFENKDAVGYILGSMELATYVLGVSEKALDLEKTYRDRVSPNPIRLFITQMAMNKENEKQGH